MTMIAEQFQRNGLHPRDVKLDIALAKAVAEYLDSGGEKSGAKLRLELAAGRMSGKGHNTSALQDGRSRHAQPRQPVEGGRGPTGRAREGHETFASPPSPHRDGGGHLKCANKGHAASAAPVREPEPPPHAPTKRGLTVIAATQATLRRGILILQKTSDGRSWGNVGWHELDGMRRDGAIARAIKERIAEPSNRFATLNEILTDAQFTEIYHASQKQIGRSV